MKKVWLAAWLGSLLSTHTVYAHTHSAVDVIEDYAKYSTPNVEGWPMLDWSTLLYKKYHWKDEDHKEKLCKVSKVKFSKGKIDVGTLRWCGTRAGVTEGEIDITLHGGGVEYPEIPKLIGSRGKVKQLRDKCSWEGVAYTKVYSVKFPKYPAVYVHYEYSYSPSRPIQTIMMEFSTNYLSNWDCAE